MLYTICFNSLQLIITPFISKYNIYSINTLKDLLNTNKKGSINKAKIGVKGVLYNILCLECLKSRLFNKSLSEYYNYIFSEKIL